MSPAPAPAPAPAWNWSNQNRAYPAHLHARREAGEVVLITTGNAEGSITGKLGGVRLPRAEAVRLARFIMEGEDATP